MGFEYVSSDESNMRATAAPPTQANPERYPEKQLDEFENGSVPPM